MEQLFTTALGLTDPWFVSHLKLDQDQKTLRIDIDFKKGSRFSHAQQDNLAVYDTHKDSWQHLNFFEFKTILTARVPRVKTPQGKTYKVQVPWGRMGSGFTLLMEAQLLMMSRAMPVAEVSRLTNVTQPRIWRLIRAHVKALWETQDWSSLKRLGVDETSTKKGHCYGTAFVEIITEEARKGGKDAVVARLLLFTEGKDKQTVTKFCKELDQRGVPREQVEEVAMDMSRAFRAGVAQELPEATVCFDRYHVMLLAGKACDEVRKQVTREEGKLPKGALYALRGNVERLSEKQSELREAICKEHSQIARALSIKEYLAETWIYDNEEDAKEHLKQVISWSQRSRLEPFKKLARSLKEHFEGIMGYYKNYTTSAALEALNGKLQLAKRNARGYRNFKNFQAISYLIAGGLPDARPA